jgi:hypothetical protein
LLAIDCWRIRSQNCPPTQKRNINTNDQDIITKQDYVPEIAIGVLADAITKW